nr:RNA polymerase sigma-70 factor [Mucilaginibacter sp. L294]
MINYNSLPDNDLVDLLRTGDGEAYKELYQRYSVVLLNHAYNKTRDREEAKDIVHEVFAMLWANHQNINPSNNLPGYLYSCVRNNFFNQVARNLVKSKYMSSIKAFAEDGHVITDHLVRERQFSDIINIEIANLPAKMGEVFKLSRNEYLTHKEIANKLNISEQTVSKHITNALKILRVRLGLFIYIIWLFHNK